MNQKLILPKTKKKHTRRHLLPLAIAGLVIVGGFGTLAYEVFKDSPNSSCQNGECERQVNLDIAIKSDAQNQSQETMKHPNDGINKASRMDDIEIENNRLLLQRDIQRAINATSPKKPFNYNEQDYCVLTLTKDRKSLRIAECTNSVYKRTLDLALEKISIKPLVAKYDFQNLNPTLEARLKF